MINIRYAQIRNLDISNGEGVGVSLFVQGCHFRCKNCFNQIAWDFNGGKEWTQEVEAEFLKLIDRPYIKRVSVLGGEPLASENLNGVLELIKKIRDLFPQKTIWMFTGFDFNLLQDQFKQYQYTPFSSDANEWLTRWEIVSLVDILVDGRFEESKKDLSLQFRGSSNQRIIDIKQSLATNQIVLWESTS